MKNGQSFSQIIKTVTYTVNMIWTYKKSYIFIKIFLMLFNSVIPLASVLLPGYIINEMTVDRRLNIVFSYVAILISVPVLQFIVNSIFNRIVGRQEFELNLEFLIKALNCEDVAVIEQFDSYKAVPKEMESISMLVQKYYVTKDVDILKRVIAKLESQFEHEKTILKNFVDNSFAYYKKYNGYDEYVNRLN